MNKRSAPTNHRQGQKWSYNLLVALSFIAFLWIAAADLTFRLRHPWATETEIFMNFNHAMLFRKVPYNLMRPRQ